MSTSHATTAELKQQVFARHRKDSKKIFRGSKSTTVAAYAGVFLLIMSMVAIGYQPPQKMDSVANAITSEAVESTAIDQPSVDELVATNVAAGIAERAELPIASNVANLSVSLAAESQLAQTDSNVITKPQIVQPTADSREVVYYTTKAGDTVTQLSQEFGIAATTIKWANNLNSDALEPGRQLTIPPIDGVIYTVKAGDTLDSIAQKYGADKSRIVVFNDLELTGIAPDQKLIIPGGNLPETERPGYVAPRSGSRSSSSGGFGINAQLAGASAGNRYAANNCTWYAYERRMQLGRPIGSFWGNASTWAMYASAAGYAVNGNPAAGAVMQNGGGYAGYGHVSVVEQVVPGQYVRVTEMNAYRGGGGYGIVSTFDVPWGEAVSGMYRYIH